MGKDAATDLAALVNKPIPPLAKRSGAFLAVFLAKCPNAEGGVFDISNPPKFRNTSLYHLAVDFESISTYQKTADMFMAYT